MSTDNTQTDNLDRLPPQNLEAERAVIGSIILDRSVLDSVSLQPTDFYADANGRLFEHLQNMPSDVPIDALTLKDWLCSAGDLEAIGGAAYLGEVCQSVPSKLSAPYYARLIRQAAVKRQVIHRLADGLRYAYNGDDVAGLVAEITAGLDSLGVGSEERFRRMTCKDLDSAEVETKYLVTNVLVAGQPGFIGGPKKSLKSSIAIDLGLSLATGTNFLGELEIPDTVRVGIMSGESGLATIQETARRIAESKGYRLADVDGLIVSDSLPQLGSPADLTALRHFIRLDALEVLILDPTYLMMSGEGAENYIKQGTLLRPLTELGQATDCTILLVLHSRKNIPDPFRPPELEDIAWSGFQEWARQWLLIGRRERYEPGTGEHRLWLNCGGSSGHSGLWAVDVHEDTPSHIRGRKWEVELQRPTEARQDAEQRREQSQEEKRQQKLERDVEKLLRAIAKHPCGETKSILRDGAGLSGTEVNTALAAVLDRGEAVPVEIVKSNHKKPLVAYKLPE